MNVEEYKKLATKKHYRREESQLQMAFGQMLDGYEKWGKLSPNLIARSYIANGEPRPAKIINGKRFSRVAVDLKKKGVKKGVFDYYFCIKKNISAGGQSCPTAFEIWLEAKSSTGTMTKEQKEFKQRAKGVFNITIQEFRSVEEGLNILREEGILIE